jgi:hypothetical protein
MRSDSVQEFLQLKYLQAREEDLLNAVIDWAKHKIPAGSPRTFPQKLRAEVLPLLKFIRFSSMARLDFTRLCQGPLGKVLTKKEKKSISASIDTGDLSLMPAEFVPEITVERLKTYAVCRFPFTMLKKSGGDLRNMCFDFEINRRATLVGVNVRGGPLRVTDLWFTVINKNQVCLGRGKCCNPYFLFGSERFCRVTKKSPLDANTTYTLKFSSTDWRQLELPCYSLPNFKRGDCIFRSDRLAVKVMSEETNVVLVESLMFEIYREKTST